MSTHFLKKFIVSLGLIFTVTLLTLTTGVTAAPPGNQVAEPIYTNTSSQTKTGQLGLNIGLGNLLTGTILEVTGITQTNWGASITTNDLVVEGNTVIGQTNANRTLDIRNGNLSVRDSGTGNVLGNLHSPENIRVDSLGQSTPFDPAEHTLCATSAGELVRCP